MDGAEFPLTADDLVRHAGFLRGLALRLLGDEHAAEDVVQDAYVAALARPPRHGGNVRGWLSRVVGNLSRRHRRGAARLRARLEAWAADRPASLSEETAARLEIQRRLVRAVIGLPEPYRSTVVLRFFDGLGPSEIACRTGVPVKTVDTRLSRGIARLRATLDAEHGGDRRAWAGALLLTLGTGGSIVMKKTVVVAALVLLVGLAVFWRTAETPDRAPSPAPDGSPAVTMSTGAASAEPESAAPEAAPARPAARETATLHGQVRDAATDAPIPDAAVVAYDHERDRVYRTTTDADGLFHLPEADGARTAFHLVVRAEGRAPHADERVVAAREPLVILLSAGGAARGRVLYDETGAPVKRYRITAIRRVFHGPDGFDSHKAIYRQVVPEDLASTAALDVEDRDGRFAFEHLPAGEYAFLVTADGRPTTFFNGGGHDWDRDGVEVDDGALVEGLEIRLLPTGIVRFRVTDLATNAPLAGVRFEEVVDVDRFPYPREVAGRTPGDPGLYEFELAVDDRRRFDGATVIVEREGYGSRRWSFGGQAAGELFEVALGRAAGVAGEVRSADGAPRAGAAIFVEGDSAADLRGRATTDDRGVFGIGGLTAGERLTLKVYDPPLARLLATTSFVLAPGEKREIEIGAADGTAILGTVTIAGRPVPDAGVCLDDEHGDRTVISTGTDGAYRFDGLAAGEYEVFLSLRRDSGELAYLTRQLRLADGERIRVDFPADRTIEGVAVLGATGEPVPAEVEIRAVRIREGADELFAETRIGEAGRFVFTVPEPGRYELVCVVDEYTALDPVEVDLTSATRVDGVRLALTEDPRDGELRLRVTRASDGAAIPDADYEYRRRGGWGSGWIEDGDDVLGEMPLGPLDVRVSADDYVPRRVHVEFTPVLKKFERTVALEASDCVRVVEVLPGSPAEEAGVRAGDLILAHGAHRTRSVSGLQEAAEAAAPAERVTLRILRDGREITVDLPGGRMGVRIANHRAGVE